MSFSLVGFITHHVFSANLQGKKRILVRDSPFLNLLHTQIVECVVLADLLQEVVVLLEGLAIDGDADNCGTNNRNGDLVAANEYHGMLDRVDHNYSSIGI